MSCSARLVEAMASFMASAYYRAMGRQPACSCSSNQAARSSCSSAWSHRAAHATAQTTTDPHTPDTHTRTRKAERPADRGLLGHFPQLQHHHHHHLHNSSRLHARAASPARPRSIRDMHAVMHVVKPKGGLKLVWPHRVATGRSAFETCSTQTMKIIR